MYDFEIKAIEPRGDARVLGVEPETFFEAVVTVPRETKVIAGMELPQVPVTHTFSEVAVQSGQLDPLEFDNNRQKESFARRLGAALFRAKNQPVATHS